MSDNTTSLEPIEYSQEFLQEMAQKGRESLFFLTRAILGFDKVTKRIHRPICKDLEALTDHKRQMIMLPRDWYKTTIASICYPIWRAINDPEIRILLVQNTYTNACSKLAAIKQIFEKNKLFQACYPDILPTKECTWAKDSLCVTRKGSFPESTFEAAGTNTSVVSRHYDLIIEDDTVAPDFDNMTGAMMQPTRADIEKAIGWHRLAHPLLIEPAESQILVIGTRWVEDDLLEWVMKNEPHYKIVQRAVKEDEHGRPARDGKLTWEFTDDGRPKFTDEVLKQLEHALGPYMYATLYLNSPTAAGNMLFKPDWIHYYSRSHQEELIIFTSVDLASAKADSSSDPDYTVILTAGVYPRNGHVYILAYDRDRYNPGETIDVIFEHYKRYRPMRVIIEAIGYQRTLCYWLEQRQEKLNLYFPVEEVKSYSSSKNERIRGLQPYFAHSKIFMAKEMQALENELIAFPYGRHDDIIDCLSAQIPYWAEVIESLEEVNSSKIKKNSLQEVSSSYLIQLMKRQKFANRQALNSVGILSHREPEALRRVKGHPLSELLRN